MRLRGAAVLLREGYSFNSLFEMPGVLVFGCCGFLSFVDSGVWVLQGGFVD